jgi:disulfide bond formation protein DsbB
MQIETWNQLQVTTLPTIALFFACVGLVLAIRRSPSKFSVEIVWQGFIFVMAVSGLLNGLFLVAQFRDPKQLEVVLQVGPSYFVAMSLLAIALPLARKVWVTGLYPLARGGLSLVKFKRQDQKEPRG